MDDSTASDEEHGWQEHARSEILRGGGQLRRLPQHPSRQNDVRARTPKIFAENLSSLARQTKLTPGDVVLRCGISRRWYTRLMKHGLARIDKRTRPDLQRLAKFFDLGRLDDFWNPNLDRLRDRVGVDEQILDWSKKVNWPYAKKFLELLETGEHEYLKGLIDSLQSLESSRAIPEPRAQPGRGRSENTSGPSSLRQRLKRRSKRAN